MSNPLNNELLNDDPFADTTSSGYVPGPGETINPDGTYGGDLNWEDSFDVAAKHLGVSEGQWQAFISGVNEVKAQMRQWEEGGGNAARVMQDRSIPNAVRDRLIMRFMNQGMTEDEAFAAALASPEIQHLTDHNAFYEEMNGALNDLYASVGLDPSGSITGGTGVNHTSDYAVNFDFLTGEVSHTKGDAIHDFGKGLVKGIAGAAFGAGLTSFLGAYMSPTLANAVSKFVVSQVTGSGGDIGVEDALGLAFGGAIPELGSIEDTILTDIKDTVIDYVTDPDNYDDDNKIVWETHGGTDGTDGIIVNIPNYDKDVLEEEESEEGGGGAEEGGAGTVDPSEPGDEGASGGAVDGGAIGGEGSPDDGMAGEDSDVGGDIISRQVHEAILRETDPAVRDRLIKEWEDLTGEEYRDDYYDDKPFDPDPREPIGHVWVDGIGGEEGAWYPIYDEAEIPDDGSWVKGSEQPTAPPEDVAGEADTESESDIGIILPGTGEEIVVDGPDGGEVVVDTPTTPGLPTDPTERPVTRPDESGGVGSGDVGGDTGGSQGGADGSQGDAGDGGSDGQTDTGADAGSDGTDTGGGWYHGGTGDGSGTGDGGGSGSGSGDGDGDGDGDGNGDGSGVGLMSGVDKYTPQWGELFAYTTITPYQAKQLEPVRQHIAKARGMLS